MKARKSVLVGSFGRELATTGGLADILGNLALYGLPLEEMTLYTRKVEAVTPTQVQQFAARVFEPGTSSVIVAGDAKVFAAPLKAKLPNLQVIPVDQLDLDAPGLRKAP
jgi:zinc protease